MSLTYRIRNWDDVFENNRSRQITDLHWVPMPNRHDGSGFIELLEHPEGPAHYGCWSLIVQVASTCRPRGVLVKSDGTPHTAGSLARMIRVKAEVLKSAMERLLAIGWLESDCAQNVRPTSPGRHPDVTPTSPERQEGATEGRKERRERKNEATNAPAGARDVPLFENPTEPKQPPSAQIDKQARVESDPDQPPPEPKKPSRPKRRPAEPVEILPELDFEAVVAAWNSLGEKFPKILKVTDNRKKALRTRLQDPWWRENWRAALRLVQGSAFCAGGGKSSWVADIDWFLKPDSAARLLEGKYSDRTPAPNGGEWTNEEISKLQKLSGRVAI